MQIARVAAVNPNTVWRTPHLETHGGSCQMLQVVVVHAVGPVIMEKVRRPSLRSSRLY
jgi:hypothetical protein